MCPECGEAGGAGTCDTHGVARVPAGSDALLGTTIGSWRVARLLGAGGMGRVYLAVQPAIGARVAIKVLKDGGDGELVERFFNEARAVNLIRHEGIVDVIDLGRLPDGAPYIVMELLEGDSLRALLRSQLPLATLAQIIGDALDALAAAHAKGIVHRDLKPDNIFVSPSGRVRLLDFGIAKLAVSGATPTQSGSLLGTPAYMAPEQARAQPLDARADLYALGVILYEGATGTLPFSAASLYDLLDMHVKLAPTPPRVHAPALPAALETVILRALAKDPGDRFASAAELRTALAHAVEHLPRLAYVRPAPVGGAPTVPSDPLAATQASIAEHAVALDETMPSEPPAKVVGVEPAAAAPEPADRSDVAKRAKRAKRSKRKRRKGVRLNPLVLGALAGLAVLGLGTTGFLMLRQHAPAHSTVAAPPPRLVDAASPTVADAEGAIAEVPTPVPADASVASVDAAAPPPSDATRAPVRVERKPTPPPPDLTKGSVAITVPRPARFDPAAYYKTALATVEAAVGRKVRLTRVMYRGFDRTGRIDLTSSEGSADYHFRIVEPANEYCYVHVALSADRNQLALGRIVGGGPCSGGTAPPRCSPAQLWQRAVARGFPADAPRASANKQGREWVFSAKEVDTIYLPDDC